MLDNLESERNFQRGKAGQYLARLNKQSKEKLKH